MDFYTIHPISIDKVKLIPRYDLDVDGSFTAFDLVGDIDTAGLLAEVFSCFTIFKLPNGVIRLSIKCKRSKNDKRHHTIETYGIYSEEESRAMDKIYSTNAGAQLPASIGGEWYNEIFSRCHPFASSTMRA